MEAYLKNTYLMNGTMGINELILNLNSYLKLSLPCKIKDYVTRGLCQMFDLSTVYVKVGKHA